MKILWLFVILHTALAQRGFGVPYLRNSKVCEKWSCINRKLGLPDSLPPSNEFASILRSLLPPEWHGVVDGVVNTCYHDRPRSYTNTCPGQAIMHCAVDQLISKCPESYQRRDDACAPVNSLAGFQHMFTQSRYGNMEKYIAVERRPAWFLRHYFNTKCCNLPALINSTTLSECGFTSFIQYYLHNPTILTIGVLPAQRRYIATTTTPPPPPSSNDGDALQVVSLKDFFSGNIPISTDPLDCCDISEFIQPSWRQECNFQTTWEGQNRLVIKDDGSVTTEATELTSTSTPAIKRDLTIVPQPCEKETCVFNKLNIITNGSVDMDAFTRLLENLTASQPSWTKAKGRAITTCLRKPLSEYTDECEINKVLACTFDVLTENCPNATKNDLCKHSTVERTCQISSSKYRPKHRREICILPELVDRGILTECGLTSLSKIEPVTTVVKPNTHKTFSSRNTCKDLTPSTTCLLSKMGVLNKYGFVDYFKMKDRIRNYTANMEPTTSQSVYLSAFNDDLLYSEHCNSPKKLLNLLDSMLTNCPISRRRNTVQCASTFNQINLHPFQTTAFQENAQRVVNHFLHVYFPSRPIPNAFRPKQIRKIKKSPLYHYGILNDDNAPKVTIIDVKPIPKPTVKKPLIPKPLVLLPVYMRIPQSNLMIRRPFIENGVMRGFPMNNPTNNAHIFNPTTTTTPISTTPVTTNLNLSHRNSTTRPFSTRFNFPKNGRLDTPLKPE